MKIYTFMEKEYANEFIEVPKTPSNRLGYEPKPTASNELIQSIYRFNAQVENHKIAYDGIKCSNRMIEMFKASNCYRQMSEERRQEVIQYLKDNPDVDDPSIDY